MLAFYSARGLCLPAPVFGELPTFPLDKGENSVYIIFRRRIVWFPGFPACPQAQAEDIQVYHRSLRGSGGTADTLALGASAARREGSNPSFPTTKYTARVRKPFHMRE